MKRILSLGQSAKCLKMGKAGAATMVSRLEALGLITKEPNPLDARVNVLKLTDKARAKHTRIQKTVLDLKKLLSRKSALLL